MEETGTQNLPVITMISTGTKSLFLVAVILTFYRHVVSVPLLSTVNHINNLKPWKIANYSVHREESDVKHGSLADDDLHADRIFGGRYARRNQFPFVAVVHRLMGGGMIAQCGGTIISHRWVLTAGHCVSYGTHQFLVVFGTTDQSGVGYNFYEGSGIAMMTDQAFLHPEFSLSVNDVGLLLMPRDIPFSRSIQAVQLAGSNEIGESFAKKNGIAIGWGKDGPTGVGTTRLKYAILPIISNQDCGRIWDITDKHVCTAAGYGRDACQGDSGGPLIVLQLGVPLQIGIVSYGDAGCPSNKPGVFSRITGYIDWIEQITGLNL
ncbi:chymotrypsin-2 [Andrena cerasifolii]|uniref:chymotrypsin-2 n=1 Tax=Andrena cerasifolii TaxID=2819439 RepID=UPI004037ADAC